MEVNNDQQPVNIYAVALWCVLLLAAVFAYFPGLHGPYLVDDFGSLSALGQYGGVNDWESLKLYLLGGVSGPTGRPVALLSFLLDANNWPAESWPFKRTNLVIHLINASLLGILINKILRLLGYRQTNASWIALGAAGCWLLHPFLVSTTLYAVQRMAQLATLFVFCGLLTHLYGRSVAATNPGKGYAIMTSSLLLFTALATLSKENGALLPTLVGVFELTVLAASRLRPLDSRWAAVFLVVPTILIGAVLVFKGFAHGFFSTLPPRNYSVFERLITQPRVLTDYAANWFIPKLYTTGIFQDHVVVSRSLFSPITTVFSMVFHLVVVTAAFVHRSKYPIAAFAVLFFYAGHLLESTTLNLEIYFEHRNYLPAAFLFLPVFVFIRDKMRFSMFVVVSAAFLLVLGGFTRYTATIWSDYPSMVQASAKKAPTSARAHAELAKILFNDGRFEESLSVVDQGIARQAFVRPHLELIRLTMLCNLSLLDDDELGRVTQRMMTTTYDERLLSIFDEFVQSVLGGKCPNTSLDALHSVFDKMLENPVNADTRSLRFSQIQYFMGLVDSRNGLPDRASSEFRASLEANPSASAALNIAAILSTGGHHSQGLEFVTTARTLYEEGRTAGGVAEVESEGDIDRLESMIRRRMSPQGTDD